MHRLIMIVLLGLLTVQAAAAADPGVNGKWYGRMPGGDYRLRGVAFIFEVNPDKLTGWIADSYGELPLQDGKVAGNGISFTVLYEVGNQTVKRFFKGTLSGEELKFVREGESGKNRYEFSVKRM